MEKKYATVYFRDDGLVGSHTGEFTCDTLTKALQVVHKICIDNFTTVNLREEGDGGNMLNITYSGTCSRGMLMEAFTKPVPSKSSSGLASQLKKLLNDILSPFLWEGEGIKSFIDIKATRADSDYMDVILVLVIADVTLEDAGIATELLSSDGIRDDNPIFSSTSYYWG